MQHRLVLKLGITGLFIAIFVVSSIMTPSDVSVIDSHLENSSDKTTLPIISSNNYTSDIIGVGNNQTIRIDLQKNGTTSLVNELNISSDSDEEYLSRGQFNFSLPTNYNTTYEFETDNTLDNPMYRSPAVVGSKNMTNTTGSWISGTDSAMDDTGTDYIEYKANSEILNLTLTANYSLPTTYTPAMDVRLIIGFLSSLKVGSQRNLLLNISMYDIFNDKWITLSINSSINQTSTLASFLTYNYALRNENLRFVYPDPNNPTKKANATFSFVFYNASFTDYSIRIYDLKVDAVQGYETPISDTEYVALEFDIKGNATIHGFNVWLRTKNEGGIINLNATIVPANSTLYQKRSELLYKGLDMSLKIIPNMTAAIYSEVFPINSDKPDWYQFSGDGVNLTIGNYFLILRGDNTNNSKFGLSILPDALPTTPGIEMKVDPNGRIDHLLLKTTNNANSWNYQRVGSYTPHICDAAPFILNITRGWLATELNLSLVDNGVDNLVLNSFNYNHSHDQTGLYATYWWGLGTINLNRDYDKTGVKAVAGNFPFELKWNTTFVPTLNFDLNYNITKYLFQNGSSIYTLAINQKPVWNVTYELKNATFSNYKIEKIGFYYALDWILIDGYDKNNFTGRNYLQNLTFGSTDVTNFVFLNVNSSYLIDGNYTFIANSPNYIAKVDPYLNYKDGLWYTAGFMQGDNVSLRVGVKNPKGIFVKEGFVNLTIYNTTDQLIGSYVDNSIEMFTDATWYEFGKANLLDTTSNITGNYTFVCYWTDLNQAGIGYKNIYIGNFNAQAINFNTDIANKVEKMQGLVEIPKTNLDSYNLYYYVINELSNQDLTDLGNNYLKNKTVDSELAYDIYLKSIALNETVFNEGETVKFQVILENRNLLLNYNVSVIVSVVSSYSDIWVIANKSSDYKLLNFAGFNSGNDTQTFDITLDLPTFAQGGVNCPIRHAPVQIKVQLKINDFEEKSYLLPELYPFIKNNTLDGNVTHIGLLSDRIGRPFIANIPRASLSLPGVSHIFLDLINAYGMTAIDDRQFMVDSPQYAHLEDFKASQTSDLKKTSVVTLSGKVINEKGNGLGSTLLYFSSWNNSGNIPLALILSSGSNSVTTDANGNFSVQIPMEQFNTSEVIIRAILPDNANAKLKGFDQNLTVYMNEYNTSLTLSIEKNKLVVDTFNLYSVYLKNTGNSTFTNITLDIGEASDFKGKIIRKELLLSITLAPGEEVDFRIQLWKESYQKVNATIYFNVTGFITEMNESYQKTYEEIFPVYRTNEENLQKTWFMIGFLTVVGAVWFAGISYMRKQYNAIYRLPGVDVSEQDKVTGTKKGKYINLADLSTEKETKDTSPKAEGTTTLDDLIKEEGLEEDKS
jgi:hypothetical protein